jgi:DNA polymerase I-like protein with 3'-5' exonuclease and polymerase domains
MYPEFSRAYYKAMRIFDTRGYVFLMPNTPYQMPSYRGPRDYPRTAWNRIVQGSLAVFLQLWLVEVEKRWPGLMVLTVHDSIVLECPLELGDALAEEIAEFTGRFATEIFGVTMLCDHERYKSYIQDDQEEWVIAA